MSKAWSRWRLIDPSLLVLMWPDHYLILVTRRIHWRRDCGGGRARRTSRVRCGLREGSHGIISITAITPLVGHLSNEAPETITGCLRNISNCDYRKTNPKPTMRNQILANTHRDDHLGSSNPRHQSLPHQSHRSRIQSPSSFRTSSPLDKELQPRWNAAIVLQILWWRWTRWMMINRVRIQIIHVDQPQANKGQYSYSSSSSVFFTSYWLTNG